MNEANSYLVFSVQAQRFALPLANVERVTQAGAVRVLPGTPGAVLGVANIQGRVLPVISFARWLGGPPRPLALSDQFIIAHSAEWTLVLVVDAVAGLLNDTDAHLTPGGQILADLPGVQSVAQHHDDLILVPDLTPLLALVASTPAAPVAGAVAAG
jgi:purine-binding chemotaxis protein CheW